MLNRFLNALWPLRCIACSSPVEKEGFCNICRETLVPASDVSCTQCGDVFLHLPTPIANFRCQACLLHPPPISQTRSAFAYGGAIRDAIVAWKNKPRLDLGKTMATLMVQALSDDWLLALPNETEIIAMPTSFRSGFNRGFNPAGQLARAISTHCGLRCTTNVLQLKRGIRPARGLSRQERLLRVRHGFTANERALDKTLLLVDDVRTTGRTLHAASKSLKKAGAKEIYVAVLAAVPHSD